MDADDVDDVEDVLRSSVFLIPVRELAHRDRNPQTRQAYLGVHHLFGKLVGRQYAVEQRLGAKLDRARDELGLWVRVKRAEQTVAPVLPLVRPVKAKLVASG